ncbi:MAG: hypothetical protein HUU01_12280 [Saprospiraceae bacterium]|nr:hypothetical protein [Saprospiraceae bacterium]
MQISEVIDLFALGTSLCALFTSLFVAYKQIRLSENSNSFPVAIEMFKEFRSLEFKQHLNHIITELPKLNSVENPISDLPKDVKKSALTVSHYFDNIGVLVANKAVDKKLVISFLGGTAENAWEILAPYIKAERKKRPNGMYQEFFENLIYEIKKSPPEIVMKKLSLKRTGM